MLKSPRRLPLLIALPVVVAALFALSGCVYLRLLYLKGQLKNFDENIAVSGEKNLRLGFKNPLLYGSDIRFLIGANPLTKDMEGDARAWRYEFDAVRHTPLAEKRPLERLPLTLWFNSDYKLMLLEVPEDFLRMFSRDVFLESLRLAANAEVHELARTVLGRFELSPAVEAQLPGREKTEELMGPPLAVQPEEGGLETLIYRYRIPSADRPVPIIARLSFDGHGRLRRVRVTWDSASVDVEYLRP